MIVVLLALILFTLLFPGVLRFLFLLALALVACFALVEVGRASAESMFTVQNKTCSKLDYVNIDGKVFGSLPSGEVMVQPVKSTCSHSVVAGSGPSLWRTTSQCISSPFEDHKVNIIDEVQSQGALPEGTLLVGKEDFGNAGRITITSKSDCVVVQDLIANRGNCKISPQQLHVPLKFGEQDSYVFYCPSLLELEIRTNEGNDTFSWDR